MRILISISALLLSVFLVQVSTGTLGPLDALSGLEIGFTRTQIGLIGSSHFIGFILGCFLSPILTRRVGHARTFTFVTGLSVIGVLLHPLWHNLYFWMILRIMSGIAVAGAATVIESWLNAKLNNENRSRYFSFYRIFDMGGALVAQGLIATLPVAQYWSYSVIAICLCLSFFPLALTKSVQPTLPEHRKWRPFLAIDISPIAVAGVLVVGATGAALRMIGPLFAYDNALSSGQIGLFLALFIIGGAIAQFPVGFLADRFSKRKIMMSLSVATVLLSFLMQIEIVVDTLGINRIFLLVFIFGMATMPIYSLAATHANDLCSQQDMTDLSASLIFFFAIGAIASPIFAGLLIDKFGPESLFIYFAFLHSALFVFAFYRVIKRPVIHFTKPYRYIPRTSLFIANTIKTLRGSSSKR
ncbi:MAG: MFS transporter [Candidatus Puniceispirillaceae bacterium]